jgi:uncharacterized protein YycO
LRVAKSIVLILCLSGCTGFRPVIRQSGHAAERQTRTWCEEITRHGHDGDWLVIRGYNSSDHLVAVATNAELSHVGVLDANTAEVVEAVAPLVRKVSLQRFLEGADRVVLVTPNGADGGAGAQALERARSMIGRPYDFLGTVGVPVRDKFYCSELAWWSTGREVDRDGLENVLHPEVMPQFGTVLFDSARQYK